MYWNLDDDVKQLSLSSLWVDPNVVTTLHPDYPFQHMGDDNVAASVFIGEMNVAARMG